MEIEGDGRTNSLLVEERKGDGRKEKTMDGQRHGRTDTLIKEERTEGWTEIEGDGRTEVWTDIHFI